MVGEMRKANRLIQETIAKDEKQIYIDVDAPMLGEDGKPNKDLFLEDGLHLNNRGYEIWSRLVRERLKE
jgi:lysophospholipase L1-like esterase